MRYATFSPDGLRLATASADKTARLWRLKKSGAPQLEKTLVGHEGWVNTVVFSPDGSSVITSAADSTAKLWNSCTGCLIRTFLGHVHFVRTAVFSPDGACVLTSSFDGTARLWSVNAGRKCIRSFVGHMLAVNSAAFSDDGAHILTTSRDSTVRLWRTNSGVCLQIISGHADFVVSAVFASAPDRGKRKAAELKPLVDVTRNRCCLCRRRSSYVADVGDGKVTGYAGQQEEHEEDDSLLCHCGGTSGGWVGPDGIFFCGDCWSSWRKKNHPGYDDKGTTWLGRGFIPKDDSSKDSQVRSCTKRSKSTFRSNGFERS